MSVSQTGIFQTKLPPRIARAVALLPLLPMAVWMLAGAAGCTSPRALAPQAGAAAGGDVVFPPTHARINLAEDEPNHGAYVDGWQTGDQGGGGFTPWQLHAQSAPGGSSHAGVFMAKEGGGGYPRTIAYGGAAFGVYANGEHDERVVLARGFQAPLLPDDTWSLLFEYPGFPTLRDPGGVPRLAFLLRGDRHVANVDDADRSVRLAIELDPVLGTLVIHHAGGQHDTWIRPDPAGMVLSLRLTDTVTATVELEGRSDGERTVIPGMQLLPASSPEEEAPIGFAIVLANGGRHDLFLSGLQVNRRLPPRPGTVELPVPPATASR